MVEARTKKLDEFADDAFLPQHLRYGQNKICGGDAGRELADNPESDDLGQKHRQRLAEHASFGLNAADAPAEH